jgi:hypothetical protein
MPYPINRPSLFEAVRKRLGIPSAFRGQLVDDVMPTFEVSELPTDQLWQAGEHLLYGAQSQGAVAAQFSKIGLWNGTGSFAAPVGSTNELLTVNGIWLIGAAGIAAFIDGSAAPAGMAANGPQNEAALDSRDGLIAGGLNAGHGQLISGTNASVNGASFSLWLQPGFNPFQVILAPGAWLLISHGTLNTALALGFSWTSRILGVEETVGGGY